VKATETLHERGQSLWLDNITRSMLDNGTIQRYIGSYSVTGLTSNPSIFDKAIGSGDYDNATRSGAGQGLSAEDVFFKLAIECSPRSRSATIRWRAGSSRLARPAPATAPGSWPPCATLAPAS